MPKKYEAIDVGFDDAAPEVVPGWLAPTEKSADQVNPRSMSIAVLNLNTIDIGWRAWITCAKPVKSES